MFTVPLSGARQEFTPPGRPAPHRFSTRRRVGKQELNHRTARRGVGGQTLPDKITLAGREKKKVSVHWGDRKETNLKSRLGQPRGEKKKIMGPLL